MVSDKYKIYCRGEPVKVPLKEKSKNEIDNEKRKMIMDWMERTTSDRTRSMKVIWPLFLV